MSNIFVRLWHGVEDIPGLLKKLVNAVGKLIKFGGNATEDVPKLVFEIGVVVKDLGDIVITSSEDADTFVRLLGNLVTVINNAVAAKGVNVLDDAEVLMAVKDIAINASTFTNIAPKVATLLLDGSTLLKTINEDFDQLVRDEASGQANTPAPQTNETLTGEENHEPTEE